MITHHDLDSTITKSNKNKINYIKNDKTDYYVQFMSVIRFFLEYFIAKEIIQNL